MAKGTNAVDENIKQEATRGLDEMGSTPNIERVAENDFAKTADLEMFMNQELTIEIHDSQDEDALLVATPSVNGINMPIVMGTETKVKRKYVEALARCRTTVYKQTEDPLRPEIKDMVPKTVMTYPFTVLADPHANGRKWLKAILSQQ